MKLTFLGTGTSQGVPIISCNCKVCRSLSKKNKRFRSSVYVQTNDKKYILVDIGPEFRLQAIKYKVNQIDALLLTHSHADHLHGIDDLRSYSCDCFKRTATNSDLFDAPPIPVYTNEKTIKDVQNRFGYFFVHPKEGGGHAKVSLNIADKPFFIGETQITPIPMMHGKLPTLGWVFTSTSNNNQKESIVYLTDCSFISDESINLILSTSGNIKHLVIDGLRIKKHSTHFSFLEAMETAAKLNPHQVWITHLTHHHSHLETSKYLNKHKNTVGLKCKIAPAYDGLILKI